MKPLTTTSSIHFVNGFSVIPAVSALSVQDYLNTAATKSFQEGTPAFDALRCCLLKETEQALLMAGNCYVRGLEGLRGGSAYWSLVSFYYAAFFSIKAILGTYGCWMNHPKRWIEAVDTNPGTIKLQFRTTAYGITAGPHKVTWIAFYDTMSALSSFLTSAEAVIAKTPVNKSKTWLIDTRNDANYQPNIAFSMIEEFDKGFNPNTVPNCFKGRLQTMLQISRACALFAKESALRVGLSTDVWSPEPTRGDWVRSRITKAQHPSLAAFTAAEMPQLEY